MHTFLTEAFSCTINGSNWIGQTTKFIAIGEKKSKRLNV